jgi:phage-related tail fiber protein
MPRDGAGVYTLPPGYEAVTGEIIQASQHNPPLEDIAGALTASIARTGVTAVTANIPFNGFKLLNIGDATSDTDALNRQSGDARYLVGVPGQLGFFFTTAAPSGWLKANGAALARAAYTALDTAIYCGNTLNPTADWGFRCTDPLNPTTTRSTTGDYIVLPDMRGEFVRGFDDGKGTDPARVLYSLQIDDFRSHTHGMGSRGNMTAGGGVSIDASNSYGFGGALTYAFGGTETRPRNLAALACIRY